MRLLIDFGSIKTGGGAQLAENFLRLLGDYPSDIEKTYLLLPEHGPLANHPQARLHSGCLTYPNAYWKRKVFECTTLNKFVADNSIDTFYTFFGSGIPTPPGVRSIVSVAYPIICYPESPFWQHAPLRLRLKQRVINTLRRRRIRLANHVVAETYVMAERLHIHCGIPRSRLSTIPPCPSAFLEESPYRSPDSGRPLRFLLLSGPDQHKNLWRLPAIALELRQRMKQAFVFALSTTPEAFGESHRRILNQNGASSHFEFLGPIQAADIQKAYSSCDFLMNLSDLESFSNNYMEAWKAGKPLVCSDRDFARHICGTSALYVEPHQPGQAAGRIASFALDTHLHERMVAEGKARLGMLPDLRTKFSLTIRTLQKALA